MKKKWMVSMVLVMCVSLSAFAQLITVGPKIDISRSTVEINDLFNDLKMNTGDATVGFSAGLFTRVTLGKLVVQPEVLYTSSGGEVDINQGGTFSQVRKLNYNKLDIPVMIGYRIGKTLRIQAGPVASILLNDDGKNFNVTTDISENYKSSTLGYQAGIGFDIWKLAFDIKYEGNLSKFGESIRVAGNDFSTDLRNNQIKFGVGFKLF